MATLRLCVKYPSIAPPLRVDALGECSIRSCLALRAKAGVRFSAVLAINHSSVPDAGRALSGRDEAREVAETDVRVELHQSAAKFHIVAEIVWLPVDQVFP